MSKLTRRGFISGLLAGAAVYGFDPAKRSWVTEARADTTTWSQLPPLDGLISTAPELRASMADDFGHMVHRMPVAVLVPGSVDDVVKVIQFARAHGIRVTARGKGHTAFGQSQAEAGVVIDMTTLDTIHTITDDYAVVDAGVLWRDLLLETTAVGLTPPVLTNFTGLTIAGTLSVGGVSGSSFRYGAQVDNVLELQVVTGEGELVTCSRTYRRDLFDAALAGLGLCAVIVRATIRLVPARERARTFRVFYPNVQSMLRDMRVLLAANAVDGDDEDDDDARPCGGAGGQPQPRLDHIRGNGAPGPNGWVFFIEATSYYSAPDDPSADDFLGGLNYIPGSLQVDDQSYFDFCDSVYQLVELLKQAGLFALPHPWLDLFVPGSKIDAFASNAVANLDPNDFLPPGLLLFYPFIRSRMKQPMLRVPNEEVFFLFDVIRTTTPDPNVVSSVLQLNRALYDANVAQGGTHYTISAVQLSQKDWKRHFQPEWGQLNSAKHHFDPDNVLAAGVNVFP